MYCWPVWVISGGEIEVKYEWKNAEAEKLYNLGALLLDNARLTLPQSVFKEGV
jgi:hypothetical protein